MDPFGFKFAVKLAGNASPGGGGSNSFYDLTGAQTGDLIGIIAAALFLILAAGAVGMLLFKKYSPNFAFENANIKHARISKNQSSWFMSKINVLLIIVAACSLAASALIFTTVTSGKAFAVGDQLTTPVITVGVNDDGSINPANVHLKNTKGTQLRVQNTAVDLNGEAWANPNFQNSNFCLSGLEGTIFNGNPDGGVQDNDNAFGRIADGEYGDFTVSINNVDAQTVLANKGQIIYVCCITFEDAVVPYPVANEGLTYNGHDQIGVNVAEQYTLTDNVKKNANAEWSFEVPSTYTAKATLLPGYVWEDGSTDVFSVDWKINPAKLSVTTESNSWVYDGLPHTWPYGEITGFQTSENEFTHQDCEEWAKLNVYSVIYPEQTNIKNDAEIIWQFSPFEVPFGKIPAARTNYVLDPDDYRPGWLKIIMGGKKVDVDWPSVQEFTYNGAEIEGPDPVITWQGAPIDATPVFAYYDYAGNLVDGIPVNAGVYTKKIVAFMRGDEIATEYSLPQNSSQLMYIKQLTVSDEFMYALLSQYEFDYTGDPVAPKVEYVVDERLDFSTEYVVPEKEYSVIATPQTERGIYYISVEFNGEGNYAAGTLLSPPWAITRDAYISYYSEAWRQFPNMDVITKVTDRDGDAIPNWDPIMDPEFSQVPQAKWGGRYTIHPNWNYLEKGQPYTVFMLYFSQDSTGQMSFDDVYIDYRTTKEETLTFTFSQNADLCMLICTSGFTKDINFCAEASDYGNQVNFKYKLFESGVTKEFKGEDPVINIPMLTLVSVSPEDEKTLLFSGFDNIPWGSLTLDDSLLKDLKFDKWNIDSFIPGIFPDKTTIILLQDEITYSLISKDAHKVRFNDSSMAGLDVFYIKSDKDNARAKLIDNGDFVSKGTTVYVGSTLLSYEDVNLLVNGEIASKFTTVLPPDYPTGTKVAASFVMGDKDVDLSCAYPNDWHMFTYYKDFFGGFDFYYKKQGKDVYIPFYESQLVPSNAEIIAVTNDEAYTDHCLINFSYIEAGTSKSINGKIVKEVTEIDFETYNYRYKIDDGDGWFKMPNTSAVMTLQLEPGYHVVRFNEINKDFQPGILNKLFCKDGNDVKQIHDWGIVRSGSQLVFGFNDSGVSPEILLNHRVAISTGYKIESYVSINEYEEKIGWEGFDDLVRTEVYTMPDHNIKFTYELEENYTVTLDSTLAKEDIHVGYRYYYESLTMREWKATYINGSSDFVSKGSYLCVGFDNSTYNGKYINLSVNGAVLASYEIGEKDVLNWPDMSPPFNYVNRCDEFMMNGTDITLSLSNNSPLKKVDVDESLWDNDAHITYMQKYSNGSENGFGIGSGDYIPANSIISVSFDNSDLCDKYIVVDNGEFVKSYKISDFMPINWISAKYSCQAIFTNGDKDINIKFADSPEGEVVENYVWNDEKHETYSNDIFGLNEQLLYDDSNVFVPSVKAEDDEYYFEM